MYDWLIDALHDSSQIVTANRRLARILGEDFGRQQVAIGRSAWRSPAVTSWQDWLVQLMGSAELSQALPTRINSHQSRVLWERCLRREITDPLLNIAMLARQARETWTRLQEFRVSLGECESCAQGKDQRIFARAARNYQSILQRENWIDDAGLTGLVTQLIGAKQVTLPAAVTFAGFDRLVPNVMTLLDAVRAAGTRVAEIAESNPGHSGTTHGYENADAELRAAGAWARDELQKSPRKAVAIVVTRLEQDADRYARLIREGLTPGWQTAGRQYRAAVNVSYGRKLTAYPLISVALLVLRWLHSDLRSRDISALLRTSNLGGSKLGGRSGIELVLRQLPDRNWSPAMILGEFENRGKTDDARDWLERIAVLHESRAAMPRREAPSKWVVLIDGILRKMNWPGDDTLDSAAFQLVNCWRELLNDLARLELVTPSMTLAEVLGRLQSMSSETVFQPESDASMVHVLGPLEAAGMRFDSLWITGLSAANWPPPGRPSLLVSRALQRDHGMPDAVPEDTLEYAQRVLNRLLASATQTVCSYPLTDGDAEQSESGLLEDLSAATTPLSDDPGWYAGKLVDAADPGRVISDPVPEVVKSESISGGAATVQRQFVEPFAAFASGRLGIRYLPAISNGLPANLRGTLIHDALHGLYADLPDRATIAAWHGAELERRIDAAVGKSFWRHQRHADTVLLQLFALEQQRVAALLRSVVELDRQRDDFSVVETEGSLDTTISKVRLGLRVDRIDRLVDGSLLILDYKSGMHRTFLDGDGEPRDMQLVVYACAVDDPVAGLGLVNVDSRAVDINAAGRAFAPDLDWEAALDKWKHQVQLAVAELQQGDVRIDGLQTIQAARSYGLLSRIQELRRDL